MAANPTPPPDPRVRLGLRYALALAAVGACWAGLVGALVYTVYGRTSGLRQADAAHVREWLDESRVFRKTLPDLAGEYVALRDKYAALDPDPAARLSDEVVYKASEIRTQLQVMADPELMYQGYLPLF